MLNLYQNILLYCIYNAIFNYIQNHGCYCIVSACVMNLLLTPTHTRVRTVKKSNALFVIPDSQYREFKNNYTKI